MRHQSSRLDLQLLMLLIFVPATAFPTHGQTVFDDGEDHVVDLAVGELEIRNGSGVTLQACPRGGCATGVLVEDGSRLTFEEGGVVSNFGTGPVVVVSNSTLEINGGGANDEFYSSAIDLQGNSRAFLRGGTTGHLRVGDLTETRLMGTLVLGNGLAFTAEGSSHVVMSDGVLFSEDVRTDHITGHIATLNDDSWFELNGGVAESSFLEAGKGAQGFQVNDNARLTMSAGSVTVTGLAITGPLVIVSLRDNATASLTGGTMVASTLDPPLNSDSTFLELSGSATADISGVDVSLAGREGTGSWSMIRAEEETLVNVADGRFTIFNPEVSEASFVVASGKSRVTVDGGAFEMTTRDRLDPPELSRIAHASDTSAVAIRGGTFTLGERGPTQHLEAVDSATITVHGDNFNYPSGAISDLTGTLTGNLSDGSPLEWDFSRALTATIVLVTDPYGDFNANGILDAADIDLLNAEIRRGTNDPDFDLVEDGMVNQFDRNFWVHNINHTYFGDANLDGEFNSGDLVAVFRAGHYEDGLAMNSGWAEGDWNGNRDFESGDLIVAFQDGGYEAGPRAAAPVPEPTSLAALLADLIGLALVSNCRRRAV